jgi:Receptor L domain.
MKKLSIIAAWLGTLMCFGIAVQTFASGSCYLTDPRSNRKMLPIENLQNYTALWANTSDTCFQSVTLTTQAEVDAFSCVEMVGHLTISCSDITNLEPLLSLKTVSSISIFDCDNLANLNGLHSLEALTGIRFSTPVALNIQDNAILKNIDALASLRTISDIYSVSIRIESNPMLKDINGLSGLTSVPNALDIIDNARLENIDGLKNVALIGSTENALTSSSLRITGNPSLENLNGLSSLKAIQGRGAALEINNNASLLDIDELSSEIYNSMRRRNP